MPAVSPSGFHYRLAILVRELMSFAFSLPWKVTVCVIVCIFHSFLPTSFYPPPNTPFSVYLSVPHLLHQVSCHVTLFLSKIQLSYPILIKDIYGYMSFRANYFPYTSPDSGHFTLSLLSGIPNIPTPSISLYSSITSALTLVTIHTIQLISQIPLAPHPHSCHPGLPNSPHPDPHRSG